MKRAVSLVQGSRHNKQAGTMFRQVSAEVRRRTVVFFAVVLLAMVYMIFTIVTGDKGVLKYRELENNRRTLLLELQRAERDNKALRREVEVLKKDPFYMEKHAREEYGLAKPDELIFQFKDDGR